MAGVLLRKRFEFFFFQFNLQPLGSKRKRATQDDHKFSILSSKSFEVVQTKMTAEIEKLLGRISKSLL